MQNIPRTVVLGLAFCLLFSTAAVACHSDYFIEIFTKINKQDLSKEQVAAIFALRSNFDKQKTLDHRNGLSCNSHDQHVPDFVAAAAGVLNDSQFKAATGKAKTEVQKLRFEVNELKKELAEIKQLLEKLQSKTQ